MDHAGILRALACPVLYTVPVELAYSDAHVPLKTNYGCNIRFLPLIPVARRGGGDHTEGLRALCRIVHRRIEKAGSTPQQFCEDLRSSKISAVRRVAIFGLCSSCWRRPWTVAKNCR